MVILHFAATQFIGPDAQRQGHAEQQVENGPVNDVGNAEHRAGNGQYRTRHVNERCFFHGLKIPKETVRCRLRSGLFSENRVKLGFLPAGEFFALHLVRNQAEYAAGHNTANRHVPHIKLRNTQNNTRQHQQTGYYHKERRKRKKTQGIKKR